MKLKFAEAILKPILPEPSHCNVRISSENRILTQSSRLLEVELIDRGPPPAANLRKWQFKPYGRELAALLTSHGIRVDFLGGFSCQIHSLPDPLQMGHFKTQ